MEIHPLDVSLQQDGILLLTINGDKKDFPKENLPLLKEDIEKANEQEDQVRLIAEQIIEQEPRLGNILKQMEANYDSVIKADKKETKLSPEVEKFLQDLDRRFRQESP